MGKKQTPVELLKRL